MLNASMNAASQQVNARAMHGGWLQEIVSDCLCAVLLGLESHDVLRTVLLRRLRAPVLWATNEWPPLSAALGGRLCSGHAACAHEMQRGSEVP